LAPGRPPFFLETVKQALSVDVTPDTHPNRSADYTRKRGHRQCNTRLPEMRPAPTRSPL